MSKPISSEAAQSAERSEVKESRDASKVGHKCDRSAQLSLARDEDMIRSLWKRKAVATMLNNYLVNPDGCYEWQGGKSHGYGTFRLHSIWGSTPMYAHRASYLLHKGAIAIGGGVYHHCDNRSCINPEHLFSGCQGDNLKDMRDKMRHAFGVRNGMAKLNDVEVLEIRRLAAGKILQQDLAKKFNISEAQISRIVRGSRRIDAGGRVSSLHGNYRHGKYATVHG